MLFVCTANTLDTIPAPLLDRMEILEVSGYITEEKAAIASRYLSPQAKDGAGLKGADVELTDAAVATLIRYYCRESGVRRLKQQIEKVYRKAALKIVQDLGETPLLAAKTEAAPTPAADAESGKPKPFVRNALAVPDSVHVSIGSEDLLEYIGPPVYQKDRLYTKTSPVGVSCGLGYLGNGSGAVMPIEVSVRPPLPSCAELTSVAVDAWLGWHHAHRKARRGDQGVGADCALVPEVERVRSRPDQGGERRSVEQEVDPSAHAVRPRIVTRALS